MRDMKFDFFVSLQNEWSVSFIEVKPFYSQSQCEKVGDFCFASAGGTLFGGVFGSGFGV